MHRRNIIWILLIFCIASGLCRDKALAQNNKSRPPLEVTSNVDKSAATVGDIITYTLTINSIPEVEVALPDIEAELGGLEIIDRGTDGPQDKKGRKITQKWYKLRVSKLGSYTIEPLKLAYTIKGEPQEKQIQTTPVVITVQSVIPKGEELQDIVDIKGLERLGIDYQFWITVIIALLIIGSLVGMVIYQRKKKGLYEEIIIKRPAHEIALEGFYKLQQIDSFVPEEIKKLYFELSETFRYYLEGRYNFPASDWTSEEIILSLNKNSDLAFELKGQSRKFLFNTDLVKFAEAIPGKEQIQAEIQRAIQFVQATKQIPIEPE